MSDPRETFWVCLIGPVPKAALPPAADLPPRLAVRAAVQQLTGEANAQMSSGWVTRECYEALRQTWADEHHKQ